MECGKGRFFLFFDENQLQVPRTPVTFAATLAKSACVRSRSARNAVSVTIYNFDLYGYPQGCPSMVR
jgi:hypothetical protein